MGDVSGAVVKLYLIGGPVGRFMRRRNWAGVTLPVPFCPVVLMWGTPDAQEMLHELAHVDQLRRMGTLQWTVTYLWQLITRGYYFSTLEIEARRVAGQEQSPNDEHNNR